MKPNISPAHLVDVLVILISVAFIFGCIASSYKTAKTVEKNQVALGGSYMRVENLDDSEAEAIDLLDVNLRYGIFKGFDLGIANTFDISEGEGKSLSTFWGDLKFQFTNRDNEIGKPIFSLGLIKGYVYDPEIHMTSFPILLSIPINENLTPTLQYRYTLTSNDFIPEEFENPRHEFSLGLEYSFYKPSPDRWTPKIGFAIGTFNSLTGGEGDNGLILSFGFSLESPVKY